MHRQAHWQYQAYGSAERQPARQAYGFSSGCSQSAARHQGTLNALNRFHLERRLLAVRMIKFLHQEREQYKNKIVKIRPATRPEAQMAEAGWFSTPVQCAARIGLFSIAKRPVAIYCAMR
jgi:hypothetical protein